MNYRKDGTAYLLQWTVDPVRDAAGRVTHFISLQHDITARHAYAQAWLEADQRAREAFREAGTRAAAIAEAILVLEKTKRSFRSKELGELRGRLLQVCAASADDSAPPRSLSTT